MQQVTLLELCSSRGVTQLKYSNWKKKKKRQKDKIVPSMILHHQDLYCARRCLQDQAVPWLCVGLFTITGPQSFIDLEEVHLHGSPPFVHSSQHSALRCTALCTHVGRVPVFVSVSVTIKGASRIRCYPLALNYQSLC